MSSNIVPTTSLERASDALLEIALPLVHLLPADPKEAFTVEIPHHLGGAINEALAQWDDAVLLTEGVERDRYAHNLPNAKASVAEAEQLALALQLALDFPAGTFDPNEEGALAITLQPFHAQQLKAAVEALPDVQRLEAGQPVDGPGASLGNVTVVEDQANPLTTPLAWGNPEGRQKGTVGVEPEPSDAPKRPKP